MLCAIAATSCGSRENPGTDSSLQSTCRNPDGQYSISLTISTPDGSQLLTGEVEEFDTLSILAEDETKALGFRPDVRGEVEGKCLVDFSVLVIHDPQVESREVFSSSFQLVEGASIEVRVPFEDSAVVLTLVAVTVLPPDESTSGG